MCQQIMMREGTVQQAPTLTLAAPAATSPSSSLMDPTECTSVPENVHPTGVPTTLAESSSCHSLAGMAPSANATSDVCDGDNNSQASSINDLTFEAEQLEGAIRHNDTCFVRRMLELHHGRFPVNLHGSLLDKSSCGTHSHCVSQDVEILLRKSQTLLDRLDRRESVSTEHDTPPVFSNALHLAVESNAIDVARILLKYGVEPNEGGVPSTSGCSWRRGSNSVASEDSLPPRDRSRRSSNFLGPERAKFVLSSSSSIHSDVSSNGRRSSWVTPPTRVFSVREELQPVFKTVYVTEDGRSVPYDEEYTRDVLYCLPPLFLAAALGNAAMVRMLVKYGAVPYIQDRYGVTPLHLALCQSRISWPCVFVLLENGAKLFVPNKQGVTPCDLSDQDLCRIQVSLIENAFSVFTPSPTAPTAPGSASTGATEEDTGAGSGGVRGTLFRRFHASERGSHPRKKRDYLAVDDRVSPERPSSSSYRGSLYSRYSNRSADPLRVEEDRSNATGDAKTAVHSENQHGSQYNNAGSKGVQRRSGDEGKPKSKSSNSKEDCSDTIFSKATECLQSLTKMATNVENVPSIQNGLQNHISVIIELCDHIDGNCLHKPLAALLNQLLQTIVDEMCSTQDLYFHDKLLHDLCFLVHVAVSFIRGGQSLQYTSLLIVNKIIDVCILHHIELYPSQQNPTVPLSNHPSQPPYHHCDLKDSHRSQQEPRPSGFGNKHSQVLPWKNGCTQDGSSQRTQTSGFGPRWWTTSLKWTHKEKSSQMGHDSCPHHALAGSKKEDNESILNILKDEGVDLILNVLNNAITLHKRVIGSRQQCTPSQRWRHCSYHCLQILSGRALLFMCQCSNIQQKLMEEGHLKILVTALDSTHDPQLLCLVLQIVATLALNPVNHPALLSVQLPDCLTQLLLPSDEWYYTNHSTKYARYVKHHAGRILVYLGLEQRLRHKGCLFDLLEESAPPPTPLMESEEDSYIIDTSLPPLIVRGDDDKILGASVESIILEMLKEIEKHLNQSSLSDSRPNFPKTDVSPSEERLDDKSGFLYFLPGLPMVVHPLIIVRLLQHRILGSVIPRRCHSMASRTSVHSNDRCSSTDSVNADSYDSTLRFRRNVNLTINCSTPSLSPARVDIKRRCFAKGGMDTRVVIQTSLPITSVTVTMTHAAANHQVVPPRSECIVTTATTTTTDSSPIPSPGSCTKRSFRFSSIRKKKLKQQLSDNDGSQKSTSNTSEADIAAFQRELQNLPQFDSQHSSFLTRIEANVFARPRSCSVPRVTFDTSSSLLLPGVTHGPLIRSATTEGAYPQCLSHTPAGLSPGNQANVTQSSESPNCGPAGTTTTIMPVQHIAVMHLLHRWSVLCRNDLMQTAPIRKEVQELLMHIASMGEQYQCWVDDMYTTLGIQDSETISAKVDDLQLIDEEYLKLQQLVVKGDLPCSKDEAAILAGIQLRIEETWPSSARKSSVLEIADHAQKLKPITEEAKESSPSEFTPMTPSNKLFGHDSCTSGSEESSTPDPQHLTPPSRSSNSIFPFSAKSTTLLRHWIGSDNSKSVLGAVSLKDCLPPMYHNTKNIGRIIKEQKRKLFHSPVYESELHLKKLYIQTCKRLPAYGCQIFQVKELIRGKTKKRATRLLGLGLERIVLLDSKTLLPTKVQPTAELEQWQTGGGRSHDRLVLEFRGTKWSFITPSHSTLRSIGIVLWEIMQDLDTHFLDNHFITNGEEHQAERNRSLCYVFEKGTVYQEELEKLQSMLHFPEEVAFRLTETEYELFYKVSPVHYIRHVTVGLSHLVSSPKRDEPTVQTLIKRFNEVSSWVTHIIISQPTHDDRKAVLSCILRVAITCWNIGNFNSATEILAGLKSDKLKPFWLSIAEKDTLASLDDLTKALLSPEPSVEYQEAVKRALDIPHSKVIPFFGSFLRDLRSVLQGMPSLIVLPAYNGQRLEFISDFNGEDHFMSRIGVGGIINVQKMEKTHQVLDNVQDFHMHAKQQKEAVKQIVDLPSLSSTPLEEDDESFYELELNTYKPIQPLTNDHGISFVPLANNMFDLHLLQCMHHGTTVIHWEDEGSRSVLCYLKLERSNSLLTWCKTTWSALRGSGCQDYELSVNIEENVSPGLVLKYESNDISFLGLEEGFVDLTHVKEVRLGAANVDLTAISRRHGIDDISHEQNSLYIIFGSNLSDNRMVGFVAPQKVAQLWYEGLHRLVALLQRLRHLSDRRILWLKEQYLRLYFENKACIGPTPAEAIKVFGGRKWTLDSLGSACSPTDTSVLGFKRAASLGTTKLRKKKSTTSLPALKDTGSKPQLAALCDAAMDVPVRKSSPSTKQRRSGVKSTPQLQMHDEQSSDSGSPSSPLPETGLTGSMSYDNITRPAHLIRGPIVYTSFLTSNYREKHQRSISGSWVNNSNGPENLSPSLCRPSITHASQMNFLEFMELFRSFMVRSRKELKDLFEQFATTSMGSPDVSSQNAQRERFRDSSHKKPMKILGILTRNTPFDFMENNQRKKICDAIAAASVVSNCAGVDTMKMMVTSLEDFRNFLSVHQGEVYTKEEVQALIERHEPDARLRRKRCLSFEGFARYLMDKDNYAFKNMKDATPSEEDMNYPLTHYYIASSHNTYLTGHQLKGESSVELYSQVLLTGCRCVELDCWDGDDGSPVIYHGHTLTTKIPFKNVVEAINRSAFVTSPYPVILSIENHCSIQQQIKMAQIFINVFGEKLVTKFLFESDFGDDPQLPSPNQLKYRILIKNKKLRPPLTPAIAQKTKHQGKSVPGRTNSLISTASTNSLNDEDDDEYEDEEDDEDILDESLHPTLSVDHDDKQSSGTISKSTSVGLRTDSVSSQESAIMSKDKTLSPGTGSRPRSQIDILTMDFWQMDDDVIPKPHKSSSQIAPELSDLVVYCQAIKFRDFVTNTSPTSSVKVKKAGNKRNMSSGGTSSSTSGSLDSKPELKRPQYNAPCFQVSSVNESTAKKLCRRSPQDLIAHCKHQLMRIYPAGIRIDSSNFNPVFFWAFGIHMVAMNYQTEGIIRTFCMTASLNIRTVIIAGRIKIQEAMGRLPYSLFTDNALHLNTAMFEQTGSCGYVLKPHVMWDNKHMMYGRFNPWDSEFDGFHAIKLTIVVISGQYVCPNTHTGSPIVEVEIIGIPVDCLRHRTRLIQRNSLNPLWNDTFTFRVTFTGLAFLRFTVTDMGTNHVTAQRVIPLKCLRQGYRHVRLRTPQNQPLPLSTLFIYSTWEEEGLETPCPGAEKQDAYLVLPACKKARGRTTTSGKPTKSDSRENVPVINVPVKRRMFFLVVYGVLPEEPNTILKITQDSTTNDVIAQALSKANKNNESPNEYVLVEETQEGWEEHEKTVTKKRILDPDERPLEAQAQWKGEGRFILKKLGDDPSTRAWMTTIKSSANRRRLERDMSGNELQDWTDADDTFLVCIHNVSHNQPYAVLRAPVSSTAQEILAQALLKARRMEDPSNFVLVEELEFAPLLESNLSGSVRKRGVRQERRILADDENVYQAQAKWKTKGKFEVQERSKESQRSLEAKDTGCTLRRFGKFRASSKSDKESSGKPSTKSSSSTSSSSGRRNKSLNDSPPPLSSAPFPVPLASSSQDTDTSGPSTQRQVHSEGELLSDDESAQHGLASTSRLKRISFRRLKVWR